MNTQARIYIQLIVLFFMIIPPTLYAQTQAQWVGWGNFAYGKASNYLQHDNQFVSIRADGEVNMARKADGSFVMWGNESSYATDRPSSNELNALYAYELSAEQFIGLRSDSTVLVWGADAEGQNNIPAGLTDVITVGAGRRHVMAIKADGSVVAWGSNWHGESDVPDGLSDVIAVTGGFSFSVALKSDSTLVAWGDNQHGQLNIPPGLTDVVAISASGYHTLALKADGTVVSWGAQSVFNYNKGQTDVPSDLSDVIAIDAGKWHSVALKSDGTVVVWGSHGDSGLIPQSAGLSDVVAIGAGEYNTLALKADGTTVSWGANEHAQSLVPMGMKSILDITSGYDHTVALNKDRTLVAWGANYHGQRDIPANIGPVKNIEAGAYHTVALLDNGKVKAWGKNDAGQTDVPFGLSNVTDISAGGFHTVALKEDGTVIAWGGNHSQSDVPNDLPPVKAIAAGNTFTAVVLQDGTVRAWGGLSNSPANSIPTGLIHVKSISAGDAHIVVLKEDGTVEAWGGNHNQSDVPSGLTNVKEIAASGVMTLALKEDGTIVKWGYSDASLLDLPADIPPMKSITSGYHTHFVWGGLIPIISSTCPSPTNKDSIPISIDFNETVSQLTLGDFVTENCQITNLTTTDSSSYQAILLPTNQAFALSTLSVYVKDSVVTDTTGFYNAQSSIFKIDYWPNSNRISGNIYQDLNQNCLFDDSVTFPLSDFIIKTSPSNTYTNTDDDGSYSFLVAQGDHTIELITPQVRGLLFEQSCDITHLVSFDSTQELRDSLDFAINIVECPILSVKVASNRRRRCFNSQTTITYRNDGFAPAENAVVHLQLPDYVEFIGSSVSATIADNNTYTFNIGTVAPGDIGTITVTDKVQCVQGITGLDQCTKAWITPVNSCLADITPISPDWDGSSITVEGACEDSLQGPRFIIRNIGEHDMNQASTYRIFQNVHLASSDSFQLASGDSLVIQYSPFAGSLRFEADQTVGHPGNSHPQATVIACSTDSTTHFSNSSYFTPDDGAPEIDIDCLPIIDSYDPNDKLVTPLGITENRYVIPDSRLDYKVRFQNTGTDTAYKVVVIDTISNLMDISTLDVGSASHPYTLEVSGEGQPVLTWIFEDINLVDSLTDEPNSHGFLTFSIAPKANHPDGTIIHNTADIYFDFNLPIRTNDAWINYYDTVITVNDYAFGEDLDLPQPNLLAIGEYVNAPFRVTIDINEHAVFNLNALSASNANLSDLQGSGDSYSVLVSPIDQGNVTLHIPENVFTDIAGNGNLTSNVITTTFDNIAPTSEILSAPNHANSPFRIDIQLSDEASLALADFSASNATLSDLQGSGLTYSVLVTPINEGDVTVSLTADVFEDLAGNGNAASNEIKVNYDITAPTAEILSVPTHTNTNFRIDIELSEEITLALTDFSVNNASLSDLQKTGSTYSVLVSPTDEGEVTVSLTADTFEDLAGNGNIASNELKVDYDITAPTLEWHTTSEPTTQVSIQFSEPVIGTLTLDDLEIVGTPATALIQDGDTYIIQFEALAGIANITLKAGVVTDLAGNANYIIRQDIITSINDEELEARTLIAPNPTSGIIKLEFPWVASGTTQIQVINMLGKVVKQHTANALSTELDLSNLTSGSYVLLIKSQKLVVSKLLIIDKK